MIAGLWALYGPRITGEGLKHLKGHKTLKIRNISGTDIYLVNTEHLLLAETRPSATKALPRFQK